MKKKTKLVLLSGKAASGKDAVANMLKETIINGEHYDGKIKTHTAKIVHYADILKLIAREQFGWDGNKDFEGRKLLNVLGTNIGKGINVNIWIELVDLIIKADAALDQGVDVYIVPDCRFLEEIYYWINEPTIETLTVRIERPNNPQALTGEAAQRLSETSLDNFSEWDLQIRNDGDINDLWANMERIYWRLQE